MLVRPVDSVGHLCRLDVRPEDHRKKLKRCDQTKHHLQNEHASVDVKVLHQTRDGDCIEQIGAHQSAPESIGFDQLVFGQVVANQDAVQPNRIATAAVVGVQSTAQLDEFKAKVIGQVGEQQRQKADDATEQVRKVGHQDTFGQKQRQINGAVFGAGVQSLVSQIRCGRRTKVRYDVVEQATRPIQMMNEQHLATHFAMTEAKQCVWRAVQMFGDL